jgi:hypothetical protein
MHYFGGLQFQQRKLRSRLRSNGRRWGIWTGCGSCCWCGAPAHTRLSEP